ncbi:hypothetical protein [Hansschlegelia plantiphila]|uniref:Tetratricopeptide repeat protein n=1 Tax=Hansschlegelia plantiphila TaxID=374655 RepID=A0A9W6J4Q5_9HYPH|nr:hypothetical protein [Hansschlegelia plantiphila]GLK69185.1 hypothetical protein GCM10008179_28230 [Hansschlegelia plantiphila]
MRRVWMLVVLMMVCLGAALSGERMGRAFYEAGLPRIASLLLGGPVWRGATLYAQGRFAEAASAFENAPFADAPYDEGTARARAGELERAIAALNEALYRDPNDEDARYNLALVESLKAKRDRQARDANGAANASASKQKRGGEAPSDAQNDINSTGEGAAGDRDSGRQATSPGGAQVTRMGRAKQTAADPSRSQARGSVGASQGAGRTGGDGAKVAKSFEEMMKLPKMSFSQQAVQPSLQWLQTIPDDPGKFLRLKLAAERSQRAERGIAAPEVTDPW